MTEWNENVGTEHERHEAKEAFKLLVYSWIFKTEKLLEGFADSADPKTAAAMGYAKVGFESVKVAMVSALIALEEVDDPNAVNREASWIAARTFMRTATAEWAAGGVFSVLAGTAIVGETIAFGPFILGIAGAALAGFAAEIVSKTLLDWFEEQTGIGFRETMPQPTVYSNANLITVIGTEFDDTYSVSQNTAANMSGGDGNDYLSGNEQTDHIEGGSGNDILLGLGGNDVITGGAGNDRLYGGFNNDALYGGDGSDTIISGQGSDVVYGGSGDDTIKLSDPLMLESDNSQPSDRDRIYGGDGNDSIDTGQGENIVFGETGNDKITSDKGTNVIEGGEGADTITVLGGKATVFGGGGNDVITLKGGETTFFGEAGNDTIKVEHGGGVLDGGEGDDTFELSGDSGKDIIIVGQGDDTIRGGDANDRLVLRLAGVVAPPFDPAATGGTLDFRGNGLGPAATKYAVPLLGGFGWLDSTEFRFEPSTQTLEQLPRPAHGGERIEVHWHMDLSYAQYAGYSAWKEYATLIKYEYGNSSKAFDFVYIKEGNDLRVGGEYYTKDKDGNIEGGLKFEVQRASD
jgi:Ca2+-binding RTX toxin-like protein